VNAHDVRQGAHHSNVFGIETDLFVGFSKGRLAGALFGLEVAAGKSDLTGVRIAEFGAPYEHQANTVSEREEQTENGGATGLLRAKPSARKGVESGA
jgi:hypothetical protein